MCSMWGGGIMTRQSTASIHPTHSGRESETTIAPVWVGAVPTQTRQESHTPVAPDWVGALLAQEPQTGVALA